MAGIRLLITDLDGTLIGPRDEYAMYERFCEQLKSLRRDDNAAWAVVTGRSLRSFKSVFSPLSFVGATPDFIVARHAYIYSITSSTYTPHLLWNLRIMTRLASDRSLCHRLMRKCILTVRNKFRRSNVVLFEKDRLCIRFRDAESVPHAANDIRTIATMHSGLHVFEYSNEVEVRAVPATKGLAASELARHLDVPRTGILAMGDGLNDISMLDGSVAAMTGCPANARIQVMEMVNHIGGHISQEPCLEGTINCIDAFRRGEVHSELPMEWRESADRKSVRSIPKSSRSNRRGRVLRELLLIVLTILVILLALAHFNLLGPLSSPIREPFDVVAYEISRLFYTR